jgi:hypothetical protein
MELPMNVLNLNFDLSLSAICFAEVSVANEQIVAAQDAYVYY